MRVERRGEVVRWTLDRPQARNALDSATFAALEQAIADAARDATIRAVVLTGEGGTFASGGDLRELRGATSAADAERLAEVGRRVCDGIASLPVPVLAALPGAAIGGGAELAMACDARIADSRASLCFKHVRMGVTTAWGIVPRLVGAAGHATAARLLLTGQTVGAQEAIALGIFSAVTAEGESVAVAEAWARDVALGAPAAVAGMKALLAEAAVAPGLRAVERERFVAAWTSADHAEAVEAFFEGRDPRWTGR